MSQFHNDGEDFSEFDNKLWGSESRHVPWPIKLWAAVVRRAAVDWVLYRNHSNKKLRKWGVDADVWLFKETDSKYINNFLCICDILDVHPDTIRKRVIEMTEDEARRLRGMEFGDEA